MEHVVNVLVDGAERLGELSYLCGGAVVATGDAVEVPFGKRVARGLVTGEGDAGKATRAILQVYGRRSSETLVVVARDVATMNLAEFTTVAKRLGPSAKRGNVALACGDVVLKSGATFSDLGRSDSDSDLRRRIVAVGPKVDMVRLAALEALALSATGQVLLLCPTKEVVTKVLAQFSSGAARLDIAPKKEDPSAWQGFVQGSVRVGVCTRAAALWSGRDLSGIIVVDEDHPGHREATMPYTSARDVAAARSRSEEVALVLLSTNPSPSGLGSGVKLTVVGGTWPRVTLAVRARRGRFDPVLPGALTRSVSGALADDGEVLVVAGVTRSRRRCTQCKHTWACEECQSGSCAHTESVCSACGSDESLILGWDVGKCRGLLEGCVVVTPSDMRTQGEADLVVAIDVDPWLEAAELVPGRGCANRVLEALSHVREGGQMVLVTTEPENPLLLQLARGDLRGIAKATWAAAKDGALPPFGRQVTLHGTGRPPVTTNWPGRVLGPRTRGEDEWEIVVLLRRGELDLMKGVLARVRRRGKVRIAVL